MKQYKWDRTRGVIDAETGQIILQMESVNCSKKFRNRAGAVLVEKLNVIERAEEFGRKTIRDRKEANPT